MSPKNQASCNRKKEGNTQTREDKQYRRVLDKIWQRKHVKL